MPLSRPTAPTDSPLARLRARWDRVHPDGRTAIMTVALTVLFTQFVVVVYAMAYTLFSSSSESKPTALAVMGDFNGDGDIDYIAANRDGTNTAKLDLYLNDGAGSYTHSTFGRSSQFEDLDAGDVDGDGDLDVVGAYDINCLRTYFNDGNGVFTDPNDGSECAMFGASFNVITLADVDSDGDLDRVMMSDTYVLTSAVELNDGTGTFTPAASTMPIAWRMAMADFNSDSHLDITYTSPNGHTVNILKGSGTGAFTPLSTVTIATTPYNQHLSTGDLDNDGDIDIVMAGENGQIYPILNMDGMGTLGAPVVISGTSQMKSTALVDVDSDGDLDIISSAYDSFASTVGGTRIWLNSGSATFTDSGSPSTERGDCTLGLAIGDIDDDGDPDYVAGNDDSNCSGGGAPNRLYASDQAATLANGSPTAPASGFTVTVETGSLTAGPGSPGSGGNDVGIGTEAWTNTFNITTSNDSAASLVLTANEVSNYLTATNFGFSIPGGATVAGIRVEWERRYSLAPGNDESIRVIKGGVIGATNRSTGAIWPISDTYASYGGSTDLWGDTWTAAQINASDFGTALALRGNTASMGQALVDHARVTVYYYSGANLTLRWGSGSDAITPTRQLQYQVRVGTVAAGDDIVPGMTASPNYVDRMMPNGQSRKRTIRNVGCNTTYYWAVKTLDTGLRLSAESAEQTLTLGSNCIAGGGGGGGGNSSSAAAGGGGGGAAWLMNLQQQDSGGGGSVPTGKIAGQLFVDVNANGKK